MVCEDNADDENDNGDSVRKFWLLSAKTYEGARLWPGQTIKGVKIILRERFKKGYLSRATKRAFFQHLWKIIHNMNYNYDNNRSSTYDPFEIAIFLLLDFQKIGIFPKASLSLVMMMMMMLWAVLDLRRLSAPRENIHSVTMKTMRWGKQCRKWWWW